MDTPRERSILIANGLSLSRVPLALALWIAPSSAAWVLSVIAVAGLTDVLDGWVVRRARREAWAEGDPGAYAAHVARGEVIDGFADKIFVGSTVLALWFVARPAWWALGALLAREVLLVPAMIAYRLLPPERRRKVDFTAGPVGKAATFFQLTALVAGFLEQELVFRPAAVLAGGLGALAAAIYVARAARARHAPPRGDSTSS
ncbi:MAG: CDP-alcohol phosphatidyltransferase family protein [Sandaracinaceae bacterium]